MSTPVNSATPKKWYDSTFLVVVLLMLVFPLGLYALFMNRRLGVIGKFMVCGAVMFLMVALLGLAGAGVYYFMRNSPEGQKSLQAMLGKYAPAQNEIYKDTAPTTPRNPETLTSTPSTSTNNPLIKGETNPVKTDPDPIPLIPVPTTPTPGEPRSVTAAQQLQALQEKARADAEAYDRAHSDRANKELQRSVDEVTADAKLLAMLKQKQSSEYEQIYNEFAATSDPALLAKDLEAQFKSASERNQQRVADFYSFLTPEMLRDYNSRLSQRREELRQAFAAQENTDGRLRQFEDRVAQKVDDANQRLAGAGKPQIPQVLPDPQLDAHIAEIKTRFAALPSRPLAVADLERFIPRKPSVAYVPPTRLPRDDIAEIPLEPVSPKRPVTPNNPFSQNNPPVRPVNPNPPYTPTQPVQPTQPTQPLPPVPPINRSIDSATAATTDINGGWRRGDGKVSWVFENGGIMNAAASGVRRAGTWTYDEKTSKLSVSLNNVQYTFTVTKVKDQFMMEGGASGSGALRFSKISKY